MGTLTTTKLFKAAYGITGTEKDEQIDLLVLAGEKWAESEVGGKLISATYTEYYSPGYADDAGRVISDRSGLVTMHYPISSVTTLHEDADRAFGSTKLVAATNYWTDDYKVMLYEDATTSAFTTGRRTVKLVYVAGYTSSTVPADLQTAVNILTYHLFTLGDKQRQSVASIGMGGESVVYKDNEMPKEARAILRRYRRMGPL